jgi:hypothetical protein
MPLQLITDSQAGLAPADHDGLHVIAAHLGSRYRTGA